MGLSVIMVDMPMDIDLTSDKALPVGCFCF
jgi:hypothetical protein